MNNIADYRFNLAKIKQLISERRFHSTRENKELSDMVNSENVTSNCPICLVEIFGSHSATVVHARLTLKSTGEKSLNLHLFHYKCLQQWQVQENETWSRCPLCKSQTAPQIPFSSVALAVKSGQGDTALSLIENGADPDAPHSWNHEAALHIAAKNGHLELALELIKRGANINMQDNQGNTAVHHAIANGNPEMLEALLTWMPDINIRNHCGRSALLEAAEYPKTPELFHLLLINGADCNLMDENGCSAIHYVAESGHVPGLRALIDKNVDVNAQDLDQRTALHYTTTFNFYSKYNIKRGKDRPQLARLLIEAGARVDLRSGCGYTAFDGADPEVIKILLPPAMKVFGVNESVSYMDDNLLYFALKAEDPEVFRELIAAGARVESVSEYCWQRFFREPCKQKQAFVEILNKAGYQLSVADNGRDLSVKMHEKHATKND